MTNLGLKLSAESRPVTVRPLTNEDEVSWINAVTPGDDQGDVGACAFYTLAEWSYVMNGFFVSESEKKRVYLQDYLGGEPDEGATFPDAFSCAKRIAVPWFKPDQTITPCNDIADMLGQPILCGLKITDSFQPNAAGCLDHKADNDAILGYHAMLAIAIGRITALGDARWVYLKNWWRDSWGYRGMCVCREDLFFDLCLEMWTIK